MRTSMWPQSSGWVSAALTLLGGIASAAFGFAHQESNDAGLREDAPGLIALGAALVVLGVPYCVLIAVGGHRMRRLDGTAWVYTSGMLGLATIALCGPCVPITWAGVAVGIWAIVTVNKPEVRDVIEANREGDLPADDEWDEDR